MVKEFTKKLTNKEIFFYNWGSISLNFVEGVLYSWIMFFYAPTYPKEGQIVYIPIVLTGTILALGRVFDAVTDPLIGNFSDNLKSKWGRRKPFIIFGTPLMIVAFIFLWTPPVAGESTMNVVYLGVLFLFYFLFYTAIGIPYDALLAEIALTSDDRVKLTSWKLIYAIIGFLMVAAAAPMYESWGPFKMAIVVGAIGFVTMYMCLPGIKELPVEFSGADKKIGLWDSLKATFSNKQFLFFGIAIILLYMCYMVLLPVIPYMNDVILGKDPGFVMYLQIEFILFMVASVPLWMWLSKKYPKRTLLRAVSFLLALFFPLFFFVGMIPGVPVITQAFIIFPFVSIPLGGFMILVYAMMGDVVDYDQMLTGKRRESMYYGVFGFSRKVGFAFAVFSFPILFKAFGAMPGKDLGIRMVWIMLSVVSLLGFFVLFGYKLGDSPEETRKIMGIKKK